MGAGKTASSLRYVAQRLILIVIFAVLLFVAAGSLRWVRGWVYVACVLVLEIITLVALAVRAPQTLCSRGAAHTGVKAFDKAFAVIYLVLSVITPVVAGLDRRSGWSPHMPMATLYCGTVLMVLAFAFGGWAMVVNEHFEQLVRIQTDRGHDVVSSGPYAIVRHPGYAASIVGALATPLVPGTWYMYIPAGAVALLLIVRTALEDRTLRRELTGYEAYTQRTRHRLLPGIW
jgi:protein-S-isoprenylcysteine O-methyltransferase Ste14